MRLECILPIREVFNDMIRKRKRDLQPNDFNFGLDDKVAHIAGPNKRGKSEAWRTYNLAVALANAGYALPGVSSTYSPVGACHFISCKGNHGYGGSELEKSIKEIIPRLEMVHSGDTVILDELGDSTNGPTALEFARRTIPDLLRHGCRVLVTSQQGEIDDYIAQIGGVSLMPDPTGKGVARYRIVPKTGEIDFKPQETLDGLGLPYGKLAAILPQGTRPNPRIGKPPSPSHHGSSNNLAF